MTKFCRDCIYASSDSNLARCFFATKIDENLDYLIDGNPKNITILTDPCSQARGPARYSYSVSSCSNKPHCGRNAINYIDINDKSHFEYGTIRDYWEPNRKDRIQKIYRKEMWKTFWSKLWMGFKK